MEIGLGANFKRSKNTRNWSNLLLELVMLALSLIKIIHHLIDYRWRFISDLQRKFKQAGVYSYSS
ncbi:hypothetical protein [Vibrio gallaecicus]|uniref:hypothetical protein n=1 Tax=Vibrio gallaecicus TaxID=552386 RepID=UPI0025B3454F|nr:hypothetical protein [Vibrio gallaecicus]MDN3615494.1 hypothetical protein [Vibrio gallaecicus]